MVYLKVAKREDDTSSQHKEKEIAHLVLSVIPIITTSHIMKTLINHS